MKIDKVDALHSLRPNSLWVLQANVLNWKDSKQTEPTEAEIETAHAEWQSEYDAEQVAKSDRIASAKAKLEALGLTTDEVRDAFGI